MCVKTFQHFSKCDHVSTTLTTCPTYHKEQSSSSGGLFSCLFRSSSSNNKNKRANCGRVVPHHLTNETYCQACCVKQGHLFASGVGQGALRVTHRRQQEIEDGFREERKRAAKASLNKAERQRAKQQQGQQQQKSQQSQTQTQSHSRSNHEILHVQSSVWLHDLYHHPETLARKEAYARQAAAAPPISSSTSSSASSRPLLSNSRNTRSTENSNSHDRSRRGGLVRDAAAAAVGVPVSVPEWTPSYGSSQPMQRPTPPTPTYQYSGRFANNNNNNAPGLPPAFGLPPVPPKKASSSSRSNSSYVHHHHPLTSSTNNLNLNPDSNPIPAPLFASASTSASAPEPRSKYPELRHKTGRVYNSTKSRNPPTKPAYREYLDAMELQGAMERLQEAKERNARERERLCPPRPGMRREESKSKTKNSYSHHRHQGSGGSGGSGGSSSSTNWIKKKVGLATAADDSDDESFACLDARAISNGYVPGQYRPDGVGGSSSSGSSRHQQHHHRSRK